MANKRLAMPIQDEILRLKSIGRSKRQTAKLLNIDRATVSRYWNGPPDLPVSKIPAWAKKVDWDYLQKELKSSTRKVLYEELSLTIDTLPSYQAFCSYLKSQINTDEVDVVIKIDRTPGASVEVDYSGDSVLILNPATGELHKTELFVASLSYSGYFYAEFTMTQRMEDWVRSHNNMFSFFGGVPSYIVPDNCKTAVTKTDKYTPVINQTYQDLCRHYGLVVDPADPRSPRHKPNVENAVKYIQSDFLSRIRNKTFTSLIELNKELRKWLNEVNNKEIQGRGKSRSFFYEREKDALCELPANHYELHYFKKAKVHPDCHCMHEKNYYSVPYQYVGKEVDIKYNDKSITIYFEGDRIALHKVMKGTYHYSTRVEHYPEQKLVETNYHLAQLKKKAEQIGENALLLVTKIMGRSEYPLKTIRKLQGILSLENKYGRDKIEYACGEALEYNCLNHDNIRKFAQNYRDKKLTNDKAPVRDNSLICLQGGRND